MKKLNNNDNNKIDKTFVFHIFKQMFAPEPEIKWSHVIIQYCISSFFSLAFAVICFILYSTYSNIVCTTSGILIQDWVLGTGVAHCIIPLLNITIFGIKDKYGALIYYVYFYIISGLFIISWSIVGAVMLFQNSMSCVSNPLWILSLSSLIIEWITLLFILWEIISKAVKLYKK